MGVPPRGYTPDVQNGGDPGGIRQQIGLTLGIVQGVADRQHEMREEMRSISGEVRSLDRSFLALKNEVESLKLKVAELSTAVEPVSSLVYDRKRLMAWASVIGILLFAGWEIIHPLITEVFKHLLGTK